MKKMVCVGDAVISIAGRDEGQIYIVLAVDCDYVSLANGFERKSVSPKKKNVKHTKIVEKLYVSAQDIEKNNNLDAILHNAVAKLKGNINVKGRCDRD